MKKMACVIGILGVFDLFFWFPAFAGLPPNPVNGQSVTDYDLLRYLSTYNATLAPQPPGTVVGASTCTGATPISPSAVTNPCASTFTALSSTNYSLTNISGNITSGATGFGEDFVGTVNDTTPVDGVFSKAVITCTVCSGGTNFVDWYNGPVSLFALDQFGDLTINANFNLGGSSAINWNGRVFLSSPASNNLQIGDGSSGTPSTQTLSVQGSVGGTSVNISGGNLIIQSGLGTGNAIGSTIMLETPVPATSGTTQQSAYTDLSLSSTAITIGNTTTNPAISLLGLTTGTNADFLCLSSVGVILVQASACTISSLRFKEQVKTFTGDALTELEKLQVVSYQLKDVGNHDANATHNQIGLIAENIAEVEPKCAVYEEDMKTPKSYRPECITALLVAASQERQHVVDVQFRWIYSLLFLIGLLALHGFHLHVRVRRVEQT